MARLVNCQSDLPPPHRLDHAVLHQAGNPFCSAIAALTRSGERKASEIVMFTLRMLQPSRSAMVSAVAVASEVSSSSQRRPRAIDATNVARVSERIGRASCGETPSGKRISRRRVAIVFCQGICRVRLAIDSFCSGKFDNQLLPLDLDAGDVTLYEGPLIDWLR